MNTIVIIIFIQNKLHIATIGKRIIYTDCIDIKNWLMIHLNQTHQGADRVEKNEADIHIQ